MYIAKIYKIFKESKSIISKPVGIYPQFTLKALRDLKSRRKRAERFVIWLSLFFLSD